MFFMITLLLSMVSFFIFLRKRRWKFRLLRLTFLIGAVKELWRQSAQFALLQIFSTFLLNADYFVISKMVGLEIVGEYFLVKRIYLVVVAFHFALLLPVWSAYTESVESKDFVWVEMPRKTTSNAIMMPLMGIGIMLFVGNWVVPVDWKNDSFLFPLCMVGGLWIDLWVEQLFFGFSERNREFETTDFFVEICTVTFVPSALFWAERYRLLGICMALITVHLPVAVLNPLESLGIFTRFSKVGVVRQN